MSKAKAYYSIFDSAFSHNPSPATSEPDRGIYLVRTAGAAIELLEDIIRKHNAPIIKIATMYVLPVNNWRKIHYDICANFEIETD